MRILCLVTSVLLIGGMAQAHVTATPNQLPADSYARVSFTIGHGCNGSATVAVRIRLPEDVLLARPQAKPGWQITIKKAALPAPAGLHGRAIVERVVEVEWRGGPLDDAHYDEFGLSLRLPEGGNRTLWFPVIQVCQQGTSEWTQIPAPGQKWDELPHPAPFIRLLPPRPGE